MVTENIIKSNGGIELRSVVKFCVALNKSPTETLRMIKSTGKHDKCSPGFVYKWQSRFRSGRKSIEDNFRSGQLAVVTCSIKDLVKDMVNIDRRTTVRVMADELGVSCSTVHGILTEELKTCRYCRWLCWEVRWLLDNAWRFATSYWLRHAPGTWTIHAYNGHNFFVFKYIILVFIEYIEEMLKLR